MSDNNWITLPMPSGRKITIKHSSIVAIVESPDREGECLVEYLGSADNESVRVEGFREAVVRLLIEAAGQE